jgi:phosphoribosyl 1,2-cyclic phosphodiesterase
LRFASLGSGSEGNALLVSAGSGNTRSTVMLDCGFGLRECERRLERLGVAPGELSGIIVTHEHQDHVGGVFRFARRHRVPVWLSHGTWQAVQRDTSNVDVRHCRDGDVLAIGDLEIRPYTVPHDAREPIQYVIGDGRVSLGVLTDAGQATPHLVQMLGGCDALVLECTHDEKMLKDSAYPASLKWRIGGPFGHLSNRATGEILAALDQSRLGRIVGAHLSKQNNTPELARSALVGSLADSGTEVMIACQEEGFGWLGVGA